MTSGSSATGIHEPCQVRNEAALSETSCVPEGCLGRANCTTKKGFDGKNYIRLAVRDEKDNAILVEALKRYL